MEAELGEVLNVGEKFSYVYDFGSSTTLSLRVIAGPRGARTDDRLREAIHASARKVWIASSLRSSQ